MASSTARGNRVYRFSDNDAVIVKANGSIPNIANPEGAGILTAESTALCQTSSASVLGVTKIDVFIDVTANPAATFLYVKFRFSDLELPDVGTPTHWGYVMIDDIAAATGISSVKEYMVKIDLNNVNGTANANQPRRFVTRIEQISGTSASAVVWSDGAGTEGTVTFVRHH